MFNKEKLNKAYLTKSAFDNGGSFITNALGIGYDIPFSSSIAGSKWNWYVRWSLI